MDADPNHWLDTDFRFESLKSEVSSSLHLLDYAQCLDKVLKLWVRREIVSHTVKTYQSIDFKSDSEALVYWSNQNWGHRLNEIFLSKKV